MTTDVATRRVLLATPHGWCAGVDRAVQTVEKAIDLYGPPVYVRKQIVHNLHVVRSLERRGAIFVEETDDVPEGALVIFSAHGVAPQTHTDAQHRRLRTIDATCPLVTKVHSEARRLAQANYQILLIGHDGHEEVIGTTGEAPDHIHLVAGPDHAETVDIPDPTRIAWLSQTTLSVDETMATVARLRQRFPHLTDPPSNDICYATQNRQAAVRDIAPHCQLILVVGSANSSNAVRLVEVALEAGTPASHLIDTAADINPHWLTNLHTIGLTSGASTPETLIRDTLTTLDTHGFTNVQPIGTIREHIRFALPRDLHRHRTQTQDVPLPALT